MIEVLELITKDESELSETDKRYLNVFKVGFEAGVKAMMDKIEKHCEAGKPILANDNLYWLKDSTQNLRDIMDDIEESYEGDYE